MIRLRFFASKLSAASYVLLAYERCNLEHYLNLPNPTLLSGPCKSHTRAYNKNLQKSRVW